MQSGLWHALLLSWDVMETNGNISLVRDIRFVHLYLDSRTLRPSKGKRDEGFIFFLDINF